MAQLTLSLLGPFQVTVADRAVTGFAYDKVRALLAYLVTEVERPHRREALAELLWPDQPRATARHSLSQALTKLRQAIGDHSAEPRYLLIGRDTVQFNPASDYEADCGAFNTLFEACMSHAHRRRETCLHCARRLEQAVALYRGAFLSQLTIADSAAFEEWALLKREQLQQRALEALSWLGDHHEQRSLYGEVCRFAQWQIALDPWLEDAHRRLMRSLALNGQRAAALRQYEQCRRVLGDELGIEPDEATTALYELIRTGVLGDQATPGQAHVAAATPSVPRHNLPAQTTPFVGREPELAQLASLLANPECRLITLVGSGGIGKTRLSQQVARAQADAFVHGVCWVSLAPLRSVQQLAGAIADALQIKLFERGDVFEQLSDYLRDKHLLLVLDNFEHLLEGAPIVAALISAAPEVAIMTTSRERLSLHGEWVFEVEGLRVPEPDATDALDEYSAVQLFLQSARRAYAQTRPDTENRRCVARICRQTSGIPLAIELAAAWVVVLSCHEIARELARNLDFLATSLRDVPARHRSMRAVFDHSWSLLTERERSVFRQLSVFHGGFDRNAAEQITGASLSILATLVAKSLLRHSLTGRYELHELLRQYGANKLAEQPGEEQQTRDRHAAYFAAFLARRGPRLRGADQRATLRELVEEMENIRVLWYRAAEHNDLMLLDQAIDCLWLFFATRGNQHEAEALFDDVATMLERSAYPTAAQQAQRDLLLAKLYLGSGTAQYRSGKYERARSSLEGSIALLRRLDTPNELAFALHHLAAAAYLQGSYREQQLLLQESLALSQRSGDHWLTGYSLNDLGRCMQLLGDEREARRLCHASLTIFRAIGDLRGASYALNNLGVVAASGAQYAEAERLHQESLAICRANDDRWGEAVSLTQLGIVAQRAGRRHEARARLLDALRTGHEIRALPVVLDALVEFVLLLSIEGEVEQARKLLLPILHHPAHTTESLAKAERMLAALVATADPTGARSESPSLDLIVAELLNSATVEAETSHE